MSYHYKKDGSLDMRYSSSRQAVASSSGGSYSSSSNNYGSSGNYAYDSGSSRGYSSYGGGGSSAGLHYKKDGSLDMRYSSSKQTVTNNSGYGHGSNSRTSSSSVARADDLHYKKDGSLDMRYSSSKQTTIGDHGYNSSSRLSSSTTVSNSGSLHYKKDGSLDMRYKSSQAAPARSDGDSRRHSSTESRTHVRSLDADTVTSAMNKMKIDRPRGIPSHIPLTKLGLPDMRTNAAKVWVASQAQCGQGDIPSWIPTHKDGSLDTTKAIAQEFLRQRDLSINLVPAYRPQRRREYYTKKMESDAVFQRWIQYVREAEIESEPPCIRNTVRSAMGSISSQSYRHQGLNDSRTFEHQQSSDEGQVEQIQLSEVQLQRDVILGKGGFGMVYKGSWKGHDVAAKVLHVHQLSRKDKQSFLTEIKILEALSGHPNLVTLLAYSLDQPALILEFVELGSLHDLIHFNEDREIEAKITDGRIKKRIAMGIVHGMICLHEAKVVHGDLKPQNVLVTKTYEAKITDFGMATIRGKTSATVAQEEGHAVGGTAAYMAPELLDSSDVPALNTDVYSFGIVLNEIIHEEEPFADQYRNFIGRGPFAAVNHAKLGNRPRIDGFTPNVVKKLIEYCWDADPRERPEFQDILVTMNDKSFIIPSLA